MAAEQSEGEGVQITIRRVRSQKFGAGLNVKPYFVGPLEEGRPDEETAEENSPNSVLIHSLDDTMSPDRDRARKPRVTLLPRARMKIKDLNELRKEMEKIIAAVCADDSVPAMIMKATRPNNSKDWDAAGDARRFDESLPQRMEEYEKATGALISNRRP